MDVLGSREKFAASYLRTERNTSIAPGRPQRSFSKYTLPRVRRTRGEVKTRVGAAMIISATKQQVGRARIARSRRPRVRAKLIATATMLYNDREQRGRAIDRSLDRAIGAAGRRSRTRGRKKKEKEFRAAW